MLFWSEIVSDDPLPRHDGDPLADLVGDDQPVQRRFGGTRQGDIRSAVMPSRVMVFSDSGLGRLTPIHSALRWPGLTRWR